MSRERWLLIYCFVAGLAGWVWLLTRPPISTGPAMIVLLVFLALMVESAGFRIPPSDPHSLVGIVLLTAVLVLGPEAGALVAAFSGLLFGIMFPLLFGRARTLYLLGARPLLRSGIRIVAVLLPTSIVAALGGSLSQPAYALILMVGYPLVVQSSRAFRETLQGGRSGLVTWWRSSWRSIFSAEVAPLPLAWLGAAIFTQLGLPFFLLSSAALMATSIVVRRAAMNLQRQRRSVLELSALNQVSRAIISSELDVYALCDLIYREASKVVDTSSFHLGLFEPNTDTYTLVVRVQDRVRLPPLVVDLPSGDGLIGWIRETGQALLVHDFATEMDRLPARPRYQSERPPRSGIYVPMRAGEAVIGSISIQAYRANMFDTEDLQRLSLIADQAAVAIAKARAYDQARQRAVQLQAIYEVGERISAILDLQTLLPSVVRLISERFGYNQVHIFTVEDDGRLLFRASTAEGAILARVQSVHIHVGQGVIGQAAALGEALLINDVLNEPNYIIDNTSTRSELAVPLVYGDQAVGVLDVQSAQPNRFSESDRFVMQTLAGQISTAIESARAFMAQRQEAWTLNTLLQVAENLAATNSLDELLPVVVRLPPLLLGCQRCYLVGWQAGTFTPLAAYGLNAEQRAALIDQPFEENAAPLLADVVHAPVPQILNNADANLNRCPQLLVFGGRTLLLLPLIARGALLGLLIADYNDPHQRFDGRMLTMYSGMANQMAGALETAMLAKEAAEAAHLEEELRVAREIQTTLLPDLPPLVPGWQLAADWRSARLVGGDFYDFWNLPVRGIEVAIGDFASTSSPTTPPPLGIVIADVSDKGVPAALFMALSRSLVRAAALDGSPPATALMRANRWITRDSDSGMFVTLFYGVLDSGRGVLRYACAGHNPPILMRVDTTVQYLTTPGIALGVLDDAFIGEAEVALEPGDVLVCYTDGITEAIDRAEEAFGVERLLNVISDNRHLDATAIAEAIVVALRAFTGDRPPFDDVTLVVLRREP